MATNKEIAKDIIDNFNGPKKLNRRRKLAKFLRRAFPNTSKNTARKVAKAIIRDLKSDSPRWDKPPKMQEYLENSITSIRVNTRGMRGTRQEKYEELKKDQP